MRKRENSWPEKETIQLLFCINTSPLDSPREKRMWHYKQQEIRISIEKWT